MNIITPATVSVRIPVYGNVSLLTTLETRLSIHLESALPYMKTIISQNQEEQSSYDLCSFVLRNESSSIIHIRGTKVENEFQFQTHTHTGQLVLQDRSSPPTQWTPIIESQDLRTLRLRLYLKVREYNTATKKWTVSKKKFPMNESSRWTANLRFVSTE